MSEATGAPVGAVDHWHRRHGCLPESSHSPSPALGRVHFPTLPFSSAFSLRVDATHPATLAKREWLLIDQRSKWCIRLLQNEGGIGKSIPDSRVGGNLESGRFWWSTGILSSILSFPRKSENPWVFTVLNSILPCLWWKSADIYRNEFRIEIFIFWEAPWTEIW